LTLALLFLLLFIVFTLLKKLGCSMFSFAEVTSFVRYWNGVGLLSLVEALAFKKFKFVDKGGFRS
jgi:hypothetical protein